MLRFNEYARLQLGIDAFDAAAENIGTRFVRRRARRGKYRTTRQNSKIQRIHDFPLN
jgi:hypothetical protein